MDDAFLVIFVDDNLTLKPGDYLVVRASTRKIVSHGSAPAQAKEKPARKQAAKRKAVGKRGRNKQKRHRSTPEQVALWRRQILEVARRAPEHGYRTGEILARLHIHNAAQREYLGRQIKALVKLGELALASEAERGKRFPRWIVHQRRLSAAE